MEWTGLLLVEIISDGLETSVHRRENNDTELDQAYLGHLEISPI